MPNILFNVLPILVLGQPLLDPNIFALFGLPTLLAIAIAVLRYRLLDIDWFINRTLVYAIVTGMLALVYGVILRRAAHPDCRWPRLRKFLRLCQLCGHQ